jgi:hypothetical protein
MEQPISEVVFILNKPVRNPCQVQIYIYLDMQIHTKKTSEVNTYKISKLKSENKYNKSSLMDIEEWLQRGTQPLLFST